MNSNKHQAFPEFKNSFALSRGMAHGADTTFAAGFNVLSVRNDYIEKTKQSGISRLDKYDVRTL